MRRYSQTPKRSFPILKILILTAILTVIVVFIVKYFNAGSLIIRGPQTVVRLITDTGLKSTNGRTNVLVLGIGGEGHDGPNLSDTMILASIDKNGGDVALISIPRDLWAPSLSAKINAAYAFGQEKDGTGLKLAEKTVSDLFAIPVHYGLRADFNGFQKAVDLVGGLDLTIDQPFVDLKYPIEGKEDDTCGIEIETRIENGASAVYFKTATSSAQLLTEENDPFTCRYETLSFQKGPAHMDGENALKLVRSRHGTNDEGSDFARSARQQKVILAFRQKIISTRTLTNPVTIINLAKTFNQSIDTDIKDDDVVLFAKLGEKIDSQNIRRVVLDTGRDESVLDIGDPANYGGQYVLDPKSDNWSDLADYVQGEIFKLEKQ